MNEEDVHTFAVWCVETVTSIRFHVERCLRVSLNILNELRVMSLRLQGRHGPCDSVRATNQRRIL